jgi:hypothetical protein
MKKNNTPIRFQRNTSIVISSDTDDNDDNTDVQQIQTQYSTPMVQYKSDFQINFQPPRTNQSQFIVLPSLLSQPSFNLNDNKIKQQEFTLSIKTRSIDSTTNS